MTTTTGLFEPISYKLWTQDPKAFAERLGQGFRETGFAVISDHPIEQAVIDAGAVRFRPMLLTALAVVVGASVILADPIFQGLAISLLFGLLSSTLLTVLVIPAIYRVFKT